MDEHRILRQTADFRREVQNGEGPGGAPRGRGGTGQGGVVGCGRAAAVLLQGGVRILGGRNHYKYAKNA